MKYDLEICFFQDELERLDEEADLEHSHSYITVTLNLCVISVDRCNCPSVYGHTHTHTQACTDATSERKLHVLKSPPPLFK